MPSVHDQQKVTSQIRVVLWSKSYVDVGRTPLTREIVASFVGKELLAMPFDRLQRLTAKIALLVCTWTKEVERRPRTARRVQWEERMMSKVPFPLVNALLVRWDSTRTRRVGRLASSVLLASS